MAVTYTLVQSNQVNNSSAVSSQAITLSSGIKLNNLVVACVEVGSNVTTVTAPSGWTQAVINQPAGSNATIQTAIWYLVVGSAQAGQTSWTFNLSAAHTVGITISEWNSSTGWLLPGPLDQVARGDIVAVPATSAWVGSGTTPLTRHNDELWVASLAFKGSDQTLLTVPDSPWTLVQDSAGGVNTM